MYSTRATKSGTHCPQHLTHSFICTLIVFWECAGPRCVHLRDLGAADLNMSLLPPVGGPCRRPDVPLTVCRVLPAAGTSLHGWPVAAGNFDQWLADPMWLPWVTCVAPSLLSRPHLSCSNDPASPRMERSQLPGLQHPSQQHYVGGRTTCSRSCSCGGTG